MMQFLHAAKFLGKAGRELRYGEFSRVSLKLLRLQWTPDAVECDWLMRPSDPWDSSLPPRLEREIQTFQALRDAIDLRNLIFRAFTSARRAELRMFAVDADGRLELMMTGDVARGNEVYQRVPSVAMRAKLCGFSFTLSEGVLESREYSGKSPHLM